MWNQCESCKKQIESASDCRLYSNDQNAIHALCRKCYEERMAMKKSI
jgi:hypothetical protein